MKEGKRCIVFTGTHCLEPVAAPNSTLLQPNWDGLVINFNTDINYTCVDRKFEESLETKLFPVECLPDNKWEDVSWPQCVESEDICLLA